MTPDELKAARLRLGLSQPKLAKLLGVDAMTVNRWERGHQAAPPYLRLALAYLTQQQYPPARCTKCGRILTDDEIDIYDTWCQACEDKLTAGWDADG